MPNNSPEENAVLFFSRALESKKFVTQDKKNRDRHINACIRVYKDPETSEDERYRMREEIIYNVWFLFPYVLGPKKFPERLFDEALQNMVICTLRAIRGFDPDRGKKFTSYLSGWLKDAISTSAIEDSVVRPPATVDKAAQIRIVSTMPENKKKIPAKRRRQERKHPVRKPLQIVAEEDFSELRADQNIESNYATKEIIDLIEDAISNGGFLSEKEKIVLTCRFGVFGSPNVTLEKVAELFHARGWRATKEWIFQIQRKALVKLRRYLNECGIDSSSVSI